ncbi:MAG: Dabb family protein [Gammaproteobacteria bacterium]
MPVVGFTGLHEHATKLGYDLAVVNVNSLPIARGIIGSGSDQDAPVVLAVCGRDLMQELLPSLESMARRALSPISLLAKRIQDAEQATLAIRLGCSGLVMADDISDSAGSEIRAIAASCGIPVIEQSVLSASLVEIDEELEAVTLNAMARASSSWQLIDASVAQAAARYLQGIYSQTGASGQGRGALETCQPWRPVEHLIIYNTTADDETSAELAAEGRRVLDRIPGVRATWSGRSIKPDASYRWCWLIRFAHPAVIDAYRVHPDHQAYADNHFRPIAGDRISIDYELFGVEEIQENLSSD